MEYIYYDSIQAIDPFSHEHNIVIDNYIERFESQSAIVPKRCITGNTIHDVEVTNLSYDELGKLHFHYSAKNHGASIEAIGLRSTIGDNSTDIDKEPAIYFSVGLEAVLDTWDVWLKWRLNRFYNPIASGIRRSPSLCSTYDKEIMSYITQWLRHLSSREYRKDTARIKRAFEFEKIELERSDYLILSIAPGIDYPEVQYDPKKAFIKGSGYAEEIWGVGIYTNLENDYAEQWNRSTELGKDIRIAPERIRRATAFGKDDALSVLKFFYSCYLVHCHKNDKKPAEFALLPQFIEFCS